MRRVLALLIVVCACAVAAQEQAPPQGHDDAHHLPASLMGVGQVVTLRFPAERLRDVNLAIEHGAWGAFRTEFYPTYDYKPVWQAPHPER